MVHITKHPLRASETTDLHTFVLIRILKLDHEKCVSFSLDMGKKNPNIVDILEKIILSGRMLLVDTIIGDGGAYLDDVFKHIRPASYKFHKPFMFKGAEYTCEL